VEEKRVEEKKVEEKKVEEEEMEVEEEAEIPEVDTIAAKGPPIALPDADEDELKRLAGQTVKKGEDEYVIVVQGVETGLCGKYWGDLDNMPSRRSRGKPEALQAGATPGRKTPTQGGRRGSVGSAGSAELATGSAKKTPNAAKAKTEVEKATPKSSKKQVTKPEKRVEAMDSSQSESEEVTEAKGAPGRGRKRKADETPVSEKKTKKGAKARKTEEEEEPETTFSDYDSAGGSEPLRKSKGKESPAKETTTVSSKQQNAVSAALAAGVPAGQQRRSVGLSFLSDSCLVSSCQRPLASHFGFFFHEALCTLTSPASPVWRTPPPSGRWWSSASRHTTTTDGSTLGR
jgi:hypothetical protein